MSAPKPLETLAGVEKLVMDAEGWEREYRILRDCERVPAYLWWSLVLIYVERINRWLDRATTRLRRWDAALSPRKESGG